MRRLSLLFATLFCATVAQAAGDREVRGRILDMQGRPVPELFCSNRFAPTNPEQIACQKTAD